MDSRRKQKWMRNNRFWLFNATGSGLCADEIFLKAVLFYLQIILDYRNLAKPTRLSINCANNFVKATWLSKRHWYIYESHMAFDEHFKPLPTNVKSFSINNPSVKQKSYALRKDRSSSPCRIYITFKDFMKIWQILVTFRKYFPSLLAQGPWISVDVYNFAKV